MEKKNVVDLNQVKEELSQKINNLENKMDDSFKDLEKKLDDILSWVKIDDY